MAKAEVNITLGIGDIKIEMLPNGNVVARMDVLITPTGQATTVHVVEVVRTAEELQAWLDGHRSGG